MYLVSEQLTEHFKLSEFDCNDVMLITPQFITFVIQVVEPFRRWYNRPININSSYRTTAYNSAVGGDANSLHLRAMAIDFNLPAAYNKYSPARQNDYLYNMRIKWFALCRSAGGYGQMTVHNGWVHMGMSYKKTYYEDRRG